MRLRELLLLVFLALPTLSFSQNIVQAEYFIDTDPGMENGVTLFVTANNQIDIDIEANTELLSVGRHFLHVRVKDNQGVWSTYLREMFYVSSAPEVNDVTKIEYFFDEDPGVLSSSGESVDAQDTVSISLEIPTDTLTSGLHFLYVRALDTKGIWSTYLRQRFQIFENIQPEPIIAYEYAFDSIPQEQPGVNVSIEPVFTLDSLFEASTATLTPGAHSLNLRVESNSGKWSSYFTSEFQISDCESVIAQSQEIQAQIDESLTIPITGQTDMVLDVTSEIITQPTKGWASINTYGNIDYMASEGTVAMDSLEYRICNDCGSCDSAWVKIDIINIAPEAMDSVFTVESGAIVKILLEDLFSDSNDNLDPGSFAITVASNEIGEMLVSDLYEIELDLAENTFEGTTEFTVTICDNSGSCVDKTYTLIIEMEEEEPLGELTIYNAISPNGDGLNDFMEIEAIGQYPDNKLVVFDRWGGKVFEMEGYNNVERRFEGNRNVGGNKLLPSGTYYYQLHIEDLSKDYRGFIIIKTYNNEKVNFTN